MKSKKLLAFLLLLIITLMQSIGLIATSAYAAQVGDVNGDSKINSTDYSIMKQFILEKITSFPAGTTTVGDLDGDSKVTSKDASILKSYILGKITTFPVQQTTYPNTVYIAGDSTVMTYKASEAPQGGWGQFIANYFTSDLKFVNRAIGGRSSKSFVEDGRLDEILKVIKPDDYLFIQFGHNDAMVNNPDRYTAPYTTYKEYLKKYIDGARDKKAIPVLITPVGRLNYVNNTFKNDFPDYCTAMKQVASENNVALIDLMTKSLNYYTSIGYDNTYKLFMVSSNGTDYTHFTTTGATQIARLVAEGVKENKLPIAKYLK